ncbi:MAG: DUF47 family protein [Desulfurococcaceae archaeon]
MSTWGWISRTREKKALEMYVEHSSKIADIVMHGVEALRAHRENNWEKFSEEWRKVFDLEKEADALKRKILAELAKGLFHPIDREEVIRLVTVSDDIASFAKAWTRRLGFIRDNIIPRNIMDKILEMAGSVHEASTLIVEASKKLVSEDKASVLALANKVESIEEKVDEVRIEALSETFSFCNEATKISYCLLVKEIVDVVESSADRCEDVADVLRSIALLM